MYKLQSTIRGTLDAIKGKRIVLPAIQREFVWKQEQVCSLFDSLMQGYPIGTFLYWKVKRSNSDKYKWYGFVQHYHEKNDPHNPDCEPGPNIPLTAVLDGQQRLTALNIGLKGSMALKLPRLWWRFDENFPVRHLYLNILGEEVEDTEARHQFRFLREDRPIPASETQRWFKVSEILRLDNKESLRDWVKQNKLPRLAFKRLDTLRKVVHEKPVIFAYEERSEDKALHIFTRMNRGGTPLSYSDLLFSIIVGQVGGMKRDMRNEILGFVDELNSIGQGFGFDKDFVLKASLILLDARIEFRASNFNKSYMGKFNEEWDNIKKAIVSTIELVDSFGLCRDNMSSETPLLLIAYYLYKKEGTVSESDCESIRVWLIRSLIKPRIWSSGANSLLTAIRGIIQNNHRYFPVMEIKDRMEKRGKSLEFTPEELHDLSTLSIHDRTAFVLLTLLCEVDMLNNKYDIDHIFPYAKLTLDALRSTSVSSEKHDHYVAMRDGLPNLQLLEESGNRSKQDTLPSEWLAGLCPGKRQGYITKNLLGDVPEGLAEFDVFYEARRKRLEEKIRVLLGAGANERS